MGKQNHNHFPAFQIKQLAFSFLLISCLFFLALISSSCSTIRLQLSQFTKEKSTLPRDMKFAEDDIDILKETSCIVTINDDNGNFLIGKEQFSKDQISEKIKRLMEGKTPDKQIVYLEAADSVKYETIVTLLNIIRKTDNDKVGLVVNRHAEENPAVRPSRFEVNLPTEPNNLETKEVPRPNPLILVVQIDKTGSLLLNNEKMGNFADTTSLMNKLSEVFKERESNGVFREGTNEIEKTVFIKASRSIKYGDFAKIVNALKGAGTQPISLQIDDLSD